MDCPARVEHVTYDEETGAPLTFEYTACPGTLAGPVVNDATGKVEPVVMDDQGTQGSNYYCATCGQTTVIAHGAVTLDPGA
jgi:hypothetical protein